MSRAERKTGRVNVWLTPEQFPLIASWLRDLCVLCGQKLFTTEGTEITEAFVQVETITIVAWLDAPIEVCFDAARDLDLHMKSVSHTNERAVAGKTSGLIGAGEEVTWRARHFGITQHFTSRITAFDRPRYFQDTMQRGAFKSFVHDHFFERDQSKTKMTETLRFSAPFGFAGRIAEKLVLRRYLNRLLELRVAAIKDAVE